MKNSIIYNERFEKENQSKNQVRNKIILPSINNKENKINIIQNKSNIRNPQSANLSNKLLNNAIEIGKKIYNREIITPNLVNIGTILEQENIDFANNNINNSSKSFPKYNKRYNLNINKSEKNKFKMDINNKLSSSLNSKQNMSGGNDRKITNSDLKILLNNEIKKNIKEQLCYLNNINKINKFMNLNQKDFELKKNNNYQKKIDNNRINYFSKFNSNKSSNLLKKIEIPHFLNNKNDNLYNNINNLNNIGIKEISKESPFYNKIIINKEKNLSKSKNNSKKTLKEKKYLLKNNNSNESNNNDNSNSNIINLEDLCFISYSYNEYSNIPYRKSMEDYHCIKQNLLKNNSIIYSYFSIFDGHSGSEVALFLSKNLHKILAQQLISLNLYNLDENNNIENHNDKIISGIKKSFEMADEEIINNLIINKEAGSTGTIILLYKINNDMNESSRYIICANIGDSKGYILTKNNLVQITKEHKCNDIKEVERIKKKGGIVFSNRVFGTLMLTRSFGDKEMKKYGVISTPDCFCHKIKDEDIYVIIASDGVWDAVCEEEIMQMGGEKLSSDDFSKKIVKFARDKGTRDNISCIVIKLNKDV